jgi:hypothetical protein
MAGLKGGALQVADNQTGLRRGWVWISITWGMKRHGTVLKSRIWRYRCRHLFCWNPTSRIDSGFFYTAAHPYGNLQYLAFGCHKFRSYHLFYVPKQPLLGDFNARMATSVHGVQRNLIKFRNNSHMFGYNEGHKVPLVVWKNTRSIDLSMWWMNHWRLKTQVFDNTT